MLPAESWGHYQEAARPCRVVATVEHVSNAFAYTVFKPETMSWLATFSSTAKTWRCNFSRSERQGETDPAHSGLLT